MNSRTTGKEQPTGPRLKPGNIFWGLLFVLLGALFLLQNFNVMAIDLSNLWRLWPIFIVAAGVSMLSFRGWLGTILASVFVALTLGLVMIVSLGFLKPETTGNVTTKNVEVSRPNESVKDVKLSIKGGAGVIDIHSDSSASLVRASLTSDFTTLRQNATQNNSTQEVAITVDTAGGWWWGRYQNDLTVVLNESVPMEVKVDAGASDISSDLSNIQLRKLEIDSGASSIQFKLGNKLPNTDVTFDIGMSSIKFLVPKDSGVSLRIDLGMSTKNIPGLHEVSDGYFETDNYKTATNKIQLNGHIGMAGLDIQYY